MRAKLTWIRAALGILGILLLNVLIWPHARLIVEIVSLSTVIGILSAAVCGLTFSATVRVQIGQLKLRYKDVRRISAAIALVGFSFLAAERFSTRLWSRDSTGFVVTVAPFENDVDHQVQDELIETLNRMDPRLKVRAIGLGHATPDNVTPAELSRTANQTHAMAMLWGSVGSAAGNRTVTLFWTGTPTAASTSNWGAPTSVELPVQDVAPYLTLAVAAQDTESGELGKESGDVLKPLIETARATVDDSGRRSKWSPDTRAQFDLIIGSALSLSGQQTASKESLETSVTYYHRALGEFSRESNPAAWALAQSNLGATLISLSALDPKSSAVREAITAFREALQVFSLQNHSAEYVQLQTSICNASEELGEHEAGIDDLQQAVAAYRAALLGVSMQADPFTWASIQSHLGWTLRLLGDRESTSSDLEDAIAADRAALSVFRPNSHPAEWIEAQTGLAQSLRVLGERMSKPDYLTQSVSAYREILDHLSRNANEGTWVATQIGLGKALISLADYESDTKSYEQAVAALRAALGKLSPDTQPAAWATAQEGLGNALRGMGDRTSNIADLEQALDAFKQALKVFTKDSEPANWVTTKLNIGLTLADIGTRESGTEHLREAATAYQEALSGLSPKDDSEQWTSGEEALRNTLAELRRRGWNES